MVRQVVIADKWRKQLESWCSEAGFTPATYTLNGKCLFLLVAGNIEECPVGDGIYVSRQTSDRVRDKIMRAGAERKADLQKTAAFYRNSATVR